MLFKTILWRLFCFLSLVATDGKDGNGLKLEKVGPTFQPFTNAQSMHIIIFPATSYKHYTFIVQDYTLILWMNFLASVLNTFFQTDNVRSNKFPCLLHETILSNRFSSIYRGYYTVARTYEVHIRVEKIFHVWGQLSREIFFPREDKFHMFKPTCSFLFIT